MKFEDKLEQLMGKPMLGQMFVQLPLIPRIQSSDLNQAPAVRGDYALTPDQVIFILHHG